MLNPILLIEKASVYCGIKKFAVYLLTIYLTVNWVSSKKVLANAWSANSVSAIVVQEIGVGESSVGDLKDKVQSKGMSRCPFFHRVYV